LQQSQNHRAADSGFAPQAHKSGFAPQGQLKKFLGLLKTKRL